MSMVHEATADAPPARPRVQRKREARTEQILLTAEGLIADHGLEAFGLNALARELDVVPGALYRYFSSKDVLVAALHRRIIAQLHDQFLQAQTAWRPALESADPKPRVLAELLLAGRFYASLPARLPQKFRFVSMMLGDARQLIADEDVKKSAPVLMAFLDEIRQLFAAAMDEGALSPASSLDRTLILWSALQGLLQLGKLTHYSAEVFDVSRLCCQLTEPLLLGWGATAELLDEASSLSARAERQTELS